MMEVSTLLYLNMIKTVKYYKAVKILQKISIKHIYQNKEVQTLEIKGYAIINGLLKYL